VKQEAPTVAAHLTGSPKTPGAPGVGPRGQDTFEAAPVKRESMPKLTVPDAPGTWDGVSEPVNEAAQAQAEKGWDTDKKGWIRQTLPSGCGEASLAFVNTASRGKGQQPGSEDTAIQEVRAKAEALNTSKPPEKKVAVHLADGATPEEMGVVLGEMGIDVTDGYPTHDANAMSEALKRGELGLALVDSNAILNAALPAHERSQEPGQLHWVTLDGFNSGLSEKDASDDLYRVKDPVHGKYWVSAKDLQKGIKKGKQAHGGGGVLVVEKRKDVDTQEKREWLGEKNRLVSASLGKPDGHGSRRRSVSESS
jgi:hypothetical protein